jgi:GNAT superfamily N-acetyltransferase
LTKTDSTPAKNSMSPQSTTTAILGKIIAGFGSVTGAHSRIYQSILTPQQRRRVDEVEPKMNDMTSRALGDEAAEFISLDYLCCAPERQSRGYGAALVRAITDIVRHYIHSIPVLLFSNTRNCLKGDAQGRKVWLISSNMYNSKFYQAQGFELVDEFELGDDPAYSGTPIVVQMVRISYHYFIFSSHVLRLLSDDIQAQSVISRKSRALVVVGR